MKNKFCERLKELRLEQGLKVSELADELGYSRPAVGNWEHGRRTPSFDTLIEIAEYFHVSTDYLLGLED